MWRHWYTCDIFIKILHETWIAVFVWLGGQKRWSVWTEARCTRTAVRNCSLFEWLFTRTVYGLLGSLSWDEGEFWGKGWKRGWQTIFLLSSKRWSGFNLESFSEHPKSHSGQWWGKGSRKRLEGTEVEQQMVMDGDQVHSLPLWEVSRCCIGTGCNHGLVCGLGGGGEWCAQPCLPRGPPCLRRQDPSSVSKAIFTNAWKLLLLSLRLSCEGMKHRQIPSLGTQQSQHLISRHGDVLMASQTTAGQCQFVTSWTTWRLCTGLTRQGFK